MNNAPKTTTHVGSPNSLLQTKLYRPRSGSHLISRARLLERLNAGLGGKVTLVCAPAGFGKTMLLAEWVQTIERPTAWLSLDEHDNELAVFVYSLTAALQTVFPDAFQATASLLSAPHFPPPHRVAPLLSNDLADVPEELILVLDDYHLIGNSDVHTLLELLITHLPPQVHLALATRSDPPLPLVRWLAKGYLNELRRTDLRFTLEETQAFLARVLGNGLARQTAFALEERTDGWIALLQLAALSLRGTANPAAFMERLGHSPHDSINRYLLEEVLDQQAPCVRALLERMSVLEQCCAQVCIAISGDNFPREQMQATLEWLERSSLFLVPLDDRQGWYRFHPLFQRLLQQRLREHACAEELARLHQRASAWYAEQGLIDEALHHALAAGDNSGAASLVEAHFHWAFEQEQWGLLERWLYLLPEDQIQGSPCLLLARVWTMQAHGQVTDFPRLLTVVEQLLATSDSGAPDRDDPQHRLLQAVTAISWCQLQYFTGRAEASLERARSALRWNRPGEEYLASLALMYLALANQATGQENRALVTLQEALRDHWTHLTSAVRLLFAQALVFLAAGKLHQVEHTAGHLLQLAQKADLAMSQMWAHWLLGLVKYEWNNLDAAVTHFSIVVANQHQAHSWAVQEAMYSLAFAYQAQGRDGEAQKTARALLDFVQDQHNLRDLLTASAFCGRLALLQDEVEEASQWLGMAGEQDVLVGPMTSFEIPALTRIWLLLAKGDDANVAAGQALLSHLLQYVEAIHSTRKTIQVLALQARAYDLQGRETEALAALERALVLARPGGFIRTFADFSQLFNVLQELRKRTRNQQAVDKKLEAYLKRILMAMNPLAAHAMLREELLRQEGLEP
jgi:LuxR family maltose regulon positive regulatory protein